LSHCCRPLLRRLLLSVAILKLTAGIRTPHPLGKANALIGLGIGAGMTASYSLNGETQKIGLPALRETDGLLVARLRLAQLQFGKQGKALLALMDMWLTSSKFLAVHRSKFPK
jgi:hypothetical protein